MSENSSSELGNYRVEEQLGAGGMGVVYRAFDTTLLRPVALKFITETGEQDAHMRMRFLREARTAAALNHPGVCTVYHVGEVDADTPTIGNRIVRSGTPYIVMELVEGETLAAWIARHGALELDDFLDIATQVAAGLAEAHDRGIVHRDLKPGNVMITARQRVKILDFGLARQLPTMDVSPDDQTATASIELTRSGTFLGTTSYASPEQLLGRQVDARSDQFSFGIMLYEMAAGKRPFVGESPTATIAKILESDAPPLSGPRPDLPAELHEIVERCLQKDPEQRYATTSELLAGLNELRSRTVDSRTDEYPVAPGRPWRRPVVLAAIVILAGLGVLWGAGFFTSVAPLAPGTRIAVLPFQNLSDDPLDSDHIASGLSRMLIDRLVAVGVGVTQWPTVQPYAKRGRRPARFARELGTEAVLAGTFRLDEDAILVNLNLYVDDGRNLVWDATFEDSFENLIAFQQQLVVATAERLKGRLDGEDRALLESESSSNVDAYDAYLQGSYIFQATDEDAANAAFLWFRAAIDLDPNLAAAHVGLGAVYSQRYFFGWGGGMQNLVNAEQSFSTALKLERSLPRARRGLVSVYWEQGLAEATLIQGKDAAIYGAAGDIETQLARAQAFLLGGLPDRAIPLYRHVLEIDNRNEAASWWLVIATAWAASYTETIDAALVYRDRFGDDAEVLTWLGHAQHMLGDLPAARATYERAIEMAQQSASVYVFLNAGQVYLDLGEPAAARRLWNRGAEELRSRLQRDPDNARIRGYLALHLAALGDHASFRAERERLLAGDVNGYTLFVLSFAHLMLGEEGAAETAMRDAILAGALLPLEIHPMVQGRFTDEMRSIYDSLENRLRKRYADEEPQQ